TEEIDRRRGRLEIAVANERRDDFVPLEQICRILAPEDRVEEPAVALAVDTPRRRLVLRRVRSRIRMRQVERDPDARVRSSAPDLLYRPAVRQQQVMRGRDGIGL